MNSALPSPSASSKTASSAPDGVIEALLRYVGSITRHLTALAGLARLEAQEAAENYLKVAVFLILGLVFGIFGYIFLILFVAFLIGALFGISWVWILLALSGLHIALAGVCAWNIREGLQKPVFPATAAEVRRDVAQLSGDPAPSAPMPPPYV